ncbi:MAG: 50S ribosomal protein L18Ae [Candidatus Bathyarchaeia archaeon]
MSELKVFRVTGKIQKPNLKTSFKKEVIAVKPQHAVETVYSELGSRHRVKRFHIVIDKVEEIPFQEVKHPLIRKLAAGETANVTKN